MKNRGFTDLDTEIETPNGFSEAGKPLKRRVDINLLKSKLQETESREFKKKLIILAKYDDIYFGLIVNNFNGRLTPNNFLN